MVHLNGENREMETGHWEKKNVKYETMWLQTHHPAVVWPSASHWAVLLLCYLCCRPDRWWLTCCRITVCVCVCCVCAFYLFFHACMSLTGCQIISFWLTVTVCMEFSTCVIFPVLRLSWIQCHSVLCFLFHCLCYLRVGKQCVSVGMWVWN